MTTLKELMSLRGRRALITGANGGIGRMMAETLAEMGADLILVDRPGTALDPLEKKMRESWNVNAWTLACDLEVEMQRDEMIGVVKSDGQGLDILINNAAFAGSSDLQGWVVPFEEQSVDTCRRALEVNLVAVFHLSRAFMPELRSSKGGSIINVASIYGELGPDWRLYEDTAMGNPAAYAASKGGLIQLTRWLATTIAPHARANSISPGGVFRNQPEAFVRRYEARTPLGRMASEDDFRGVVAFLASDMSRYATGQNFIIDGGWSAW